MIGQNIRLTVKEGMESGFESLVTQLMRDVITHEPQAVYDVRRIRNAPRSYLYFVTFLDRAGYDRYMKAHYHTEMSLKAGAMLEGEPVFVDLDSFV